MSLCCTCTASNAAGVSTNPSSAGVEFVTFASILVAVSTSLAGTLAETCGHADDAIVGMVEGNAVTSVCVFSCDAAAPDGMEVASEASLEATFFSAPSCTAWSSH